MSESSSHSQPFATATQLVRDFPLVRRMTEQGPVRITSHGRTEAIMLSPQDYSHMSSGNFVDSERLEWKLSLVLDSIETHVLILDENLNIRRANRVAGETYAIPPEEMSGKPLSSFVATPTDQFVAQRLAEVLISGQPEITVVPSSHRPDRTIRYTMKPWPRGVALFADDITEREKSRDRKIADDATDAALEALGGMGTAHVQSNGTIISSSMGLCQMVGSSMETLAGARLQSLFDPRSRTILNEALRGTSSEGRCYDVHYLRNGVTITPAILSVAPYWTAEHHASAAIVLHDPHYKQPDCERDTRAA